MFEDVCEIKKDGEDNELHFLYNREHRIKNAPANVQEYYNGGMRPLKGLKVLFTKQNRFIFLGIVIFMASIWIYQAFNKTRNFANLNEIYCELTSFSYNDDVFVSIQLKKSKNYNEKQNKLITAQIKLINNDNQISQKESIDFLFDSSLEENQFIRTKFTDFDIIRVDVNLILEEQIKELSTEVKR